MKCNLLLPSLFLLIFVSSALAIPGIPHQFYGIVLINGKPAPDGTLVVAVVDGKEVARTHTRDGRYGYDPIFYVEDPENTRSGKIVQFFVNGIFTGTQKYFCNGCVERVDLYVSVRKSSGGVSSGGCESFVVSENSNSSKNKETQIISFIPKNVTEGKCEERWVCSNWSSCKNGIQTRQCVDENKCGTELRKPLETQPCTAKEREETSMLPTGFFSYYSRYSVTLGTILVALGGLACLFFFTKRKIKSRKRK